MRFIKNKKFHLSRYGVGTRSIFVLGRFIGLLITLSFLVVVFIFSHSGLINLSLAQTEQQNKNILKNQIDVLENEIKEVQEGAKELSQEVDVLNNNIRRQKLEIRQINLAISRTKLDVEDTEELIGVLGDDIVKNKGVLAETVVLLDQYDQDSLFELLLKNRRLSDFFNSVNQIENLQDTLIITLERLREDKELLEGKRVELIEKNSEQGLLRSLEVAQKRALDVNKSQKQKVLSSTQKEISAKKKDLAALKSQLFYLDQTGISVEEALEFAELAASRVGIRTEFLLAILEVETGRAFQNNQLSVGSNLGTGNWSRDLYNCYIDLGKRTTAERQKAAFLEITDKLNYDPDAMPVSRRPHYGCGGAMGPAQFLPTTWLSFEKRVAQLTGHNPPDPWNIEDAFTASAMFLADAGATRKTYTYERRAAKTYISGRPTCSKSICNIYANNVLSLAETIGRSL